MSAALQISELWAAAASQPSRLEASDEFAVGQQCPPQPAEEKQPVRTLAFYRKHTEKLLSRYLHASMLVGRAPSVLDHPMVRGWASSRPVHTFEDAVNFVLDVERCLARLGALDRCLLNRIVVQEYSFLEASILLRINIKTVAIRLGVAIDRLTAILLKEGLLDLPQ